MCVFSHMNHKKIEVKSVLPIPIPDELPGDIVIGFREWNEDHLGTLTSPTRSTRWGAKTALHAPRPVASGNSGIYAYKDDASFSRFQLWGEVSLWGTVWEHTKSGYMSGFTGEYAYPLSIFAPSEAQAKRLLATYGKQGVYINYYAPTIAGADKKGYIALL